LIEPCFRRKNKNPRCDVINVGEWVIFGGKRLPSLDETTSDLCCDDIKTVAFQSGQLIRLLIEEVQAGFVIFSSMISLSVVEL
jgi:hypothetical protein